jgi:hypothetical protein
MSVLKSAGNKKCKNQEIRKEVVKKIVLKKFSGIVFDDEVIPETLDKINDTI